MPLSAIAASDRNTAWGEGRNFSSTRPKDAMAAQRRSGSSSDATCRPPRIALDGMAPKVNRERSLELLSLLAAAALAVIKKLQSS
jgi:hypothetical protein